MVGGRSIRARRNARMRQHALEREFGGTEGGPGASGGDGVGVGGQQGPPTVAPMPLPPMPFSRRGRRRGRGAGAGEAGPVLPKLLMKIVVYGVVMVALKYAKQNKEGGDGGATRPKPWFIERITSVLDVFGGHKGGAVLLPGTQTLRVGTSTARNDNTKTTVYVIPDFLPQDTAIRWKEGLQYEWKRGSRDGSAFHFTSLPLTSGSHEGKDSSSTTESLNATAHSARSSGQHSMARWELESVHPLALEVARTLSTSDIKNKLVALGGEKGTDIEETSVMHYSSGDFLYSPGGEVERTSQVSVMISLADIENEVSTIRFACTAEKISEDDEKKDWCDTVKLTFNTAIVMSPNEGNIMPAYEVMPLGWDGHYSILGTYAANNEGEAIHVGKEL